MTYGCQMNEHESEKIAGVLKNMGYIETQNNEDCDVIVFNTCCIRENAEKKVASHIGNLKPLKLKKRNLIIAVVGCMTQQNGYADFLKKKFPFIDIMLGTHNINLFKDVLEDYLKNRKKTVSIIEDNKMIDESVLPHRQNTVSASVNIMYGCDNFCTYCVVPYVRGRERSRKKDDIVREVNGLLNNGYKEITLLGQNVNSYNYEGDFADLLEELADTDKKFRLRFMTSHPKDLSEKIVDVMAKYDNICNAIHLPLQAGSDRILKLMNRKYTSLDYLEKINMLRNKVCDIEISTDIMVGFPEETEDDFMCTYNLMEKVKFDYAFTFIYSRRSGTAAYSMENQIEYSVKRARIQKIIALQKEISLTKNKTCIGKTYEVLTEGISDIGKNMMTGKTSLDKKVFFEGNAEHINNFCNIAINRATPTALFGSLKSTI